MKIVMALGGNALGNNPIEQLDLVKDTAKIIVSLVKDGHDVVIGHGNGPQVGMINTAMDFANDNGANTPEMPFAECGAMSQGYIGYHLQQTIMEELRSNNIKKNCLTIITQVVVDKNDPAFLNPTKPVGMFYSKEEADKIMNEEHSTFIEDSGRGYRKVVASPNPIKIVELDVIKQLIDNNNIVITVGGGGIPVIEYDNELDGIDAVIDKDKSCAKLAKDIDADMLMILTSIDKVYLNYNTNKQQGLSEMNVDEAKKYIKENQFAKGSMLPKIEACISFLEYNHKGIAIICALKDAHLALNGKKGTIIKNIERGV